MSNRPLQQPGPKEELPVSSARTIALSSLLISLGFVFVLYFFFLKTVFQAPLIWIVLAVMVVMAVFSSVMAMKSLLKKLLCPHCHQPFFARAVELFLPPKNCTVCQRPFSKHPSKH
ncbi:MAG: hypothetical protein CSA45_03615 [Gammaproteobacteria bacterium]|nr:MAG: hypothetical protein CSA45_03615 [Gammaproteobacteria bacterium]